MRAYGMDVMNILYMNMTQLIQFCTKLIHYYFEQNSSIVQLRNYSYVIRL